MTAVMVREDLMQRFLTPLGSRWHYWEWHFDRTLRDERVPFIDALFDALLEIDRYLPGYAARTADALTALSGRKKYEPHYEQILQRLAEIHVVKQLVTHAWPWPVTFEDEPTAAWSAKNLELIVRGPNAEYGLEVKAPSSLLQERTRAARPLQAGGRVFSREEMERLAGGPDNLTLPRDNSIKDFLASANAKFEAFQTEGANFSGVLVIVWDDFIFEPITSLGHPSSGLFTENSIAKDGAEVAKFAHVDGVVVLAHLFHLKRAMAENGEDRPFTSLSRDAFRYDINPARPVACIPNPHGKGVPSAITSALKARPPSDLEAIAEYHPQDMVTWLEAPAPDQNPRRS
jgi:hypothetical protein